jgi:hypothetical protein
MAIVTYNPSEPWSGMNTSRRTRASNRGRWRLRCDSLPDLERWLEANPAVWSAGSSTSAGRGESWDLGAGWAGSLMMAKTGWSEGAALVRQIALSVMAKPSSEREPRWGYDVAGDLPDVGRFMAGRPDNMRRRRQTHGRAPIVTICVNQSVSGSTSAVAFRNFGAALLAMIDQIEHTGRRVELFTGFAGIMRNGAHVTALTRVKGADEPVDLGALAFGTAHPAFFRRLGFAILERTPKAMESWGYGQCGDWLDNTDLIEGPETALYIDGLGHGNNNRCSDIKGAMALAMEQINRAAVKQGAVSEGEQLVMIEAA